MATTDKRATFSERFSLIGRYTIKFIKHPVRMIRDMDMGKILNFKGRLVHGDDPSAYSNAPEFDWKFDPVKRPSKRRASAYAPLDVPACDEPLVSIVIPVYNQFEYTYNCMKSIIERIYSSYTFFYLLLRYVVKAHWRR